jgi:CheY-like chemotaxis protein
MPGMSGLEVCRQIRADPCIDDVGIVIVSANASEEEARAAGADAFIAKPFSPRGLGEVVRELTRGRPAGRAALR